MAIKRIGIRVGKVILAVLIGIGMIIGILLVLRLMKIDQIKKEIAITTPNGIEEETVIEMNGIKQYLNIRGQDVSNPIIVMVHGGAPMTPVLHTYQPSWEKDYTIVNFDRRGNGETYFLNKDHYEEMLASMTPEQYIADIKAVVDYVEQRFDQDKVIILADSFGTMLASRFVLENPDQVSAYIGSAQIVNMQEDFKLCGEDMLQSAKAAGDDKAVKALSQINYEFTSSEDWIKANGELEHYVGTYISKEATSDMMANIIAGMQSPYFPISHLEYYMKTGELQKGDTDYILKFDLRDYGNQFKVPAIFVYGSEDWLTRYNIEAYYDSVEAPYKQLICIPEVGHDALQLKSEAFYKAIQEALGRTAVR